MTQKYFYFLICSHLDSPIHDQVMHSSQFSPHVWWKCERSDNREFKRKASSNSLVGQYGLFSLIPGLRNTRFSPYPYLLSTEMKATKCNSAISSGTDNILNLSMQTLLTFPIPFFRRKALSLVLLLVLGLVPNSSKTSVPREYRQRVSHSCWTPIWGLLSLHSFCRHSAGTEDAMTNFGREMEGRGELTCGCGSAGLIPPRFWTVKGRFLFRESGSTGSGRESFHHTLIMPLSWLSRKRR